MSLKAVAVNGKPLPERTNHVAVRPGDEITAEIFISDWGSQIGAVSMYVATVLGKEAAGSGLVGSIVPAAWPTPPWAVDTQRPDFIHAGLLPCTCPPDVGCIVEICPFWTWQSVLIFDGGTTDPGDGTEFYGGTLNLLASEDACGTFTFEFDLTHSYLIDALGQVAGITSESLLIDVACAPRVIGACPDNCAIDARYPHDSDFVSMRWDQINLRLANLDVDIHTFDCLDSDISFASTSVLLHCLSVTPTGVDTLEYRFDRTIPTSRWTCVELRNGQPGANRICLASLPGDVNADRRSDGGDVLALVEHLTTGAPLKRWQCDIDRDGNCTQLDLLALVDILAGVDPFLPWAGATISVPCPTASVTATCDGLPEP